MSSRAMVLIERLNAAPPLVRRLPAEAVPPPLRNGPEDAEGWVEWRAVASTRHLLSVEALFPSTRADGVADFIGLYGHFEFLDFQAADARVVGLAGRAFGTSEMAPDCWAGRAVSPFAVGTVPFGRDIDSNDPLVIVAEAQRARSHVMEPGLAVQEGDVLRLRGGQLWAISSTGNRLTFSGLVDRLAAELTR